MDSSAPWGLFDKPIYLSLEPRTVNDGQDEELDGQSGDKHWANIYFRWRRGKMSDEEIDACDDDDSGEHFLPRMGENLKIMNWIRDGKSAKPSVQELTHWKDIIIKKGDRGK